MTVSPRHDAAPPAQPDNSQPHPADGTHQRLLDRGRFTATALAHDAVAFDAQAAHSPATDPKTSTTTVRARRHGSWQVALWVLGAAFLLATVGFWLTGGRWFAVATPSMGTTAPVGTLVLTRPVAVADLHVGDVIAFRPPTEPGVTYTHRIIAIAGPGTATATVTTRGDINGATDPWSLTGRDIVGRTVVIAPGVGYLLRAVPLWALGGLGAWSLTRFWARPGWRWPIRLAVAVGLYLAAALTIRPFLGVVQLVTTTDANGEAHISAVSTGLLPIRLAPTAGHGVAAPVDLTYGQTGMVNLHPDTATRAAGGGYQVAAHLHLSLWGWVLIVVLWSLPTVLALLLARRRRLRASDSVSAEAEENSERLATVDELLAPAGKVSV